MRIDAALAPRVGIRTSSDSRMLSQVIDDTVGRTLATASSLTKELKEAIDGNGATQVSTRGRAAFRSLGLNLRRVLHV